MIVDTGELAQRVGARLRELRRDAEITQREVAARMGTHRPVVTRLESGKHLPRLDEVARYGAALGLDLATVLVCLDAGWCAGAARARAALEAP